MTSEEALVLVRKALELTLDKPAEITLDTDLFEEKILDSLDTMLFFLNLSETSGITIQEEQIQAEGLGKVKALAAHLAYAIEKTRL